MPAARQHLEMLVNEFLYKGAVLVVGRILVDLAGILAVHDLVRLSANGVPLGVLVVNLHGQFAWVRRRSAAADNTAAAAADKSARQDNIQTSDLVCHAHQQSQRNIWHLGSEARTNSLTVHSPRPCTRRLDLPPPLGLTTTTRKLNQILFPPKSRCHCARDALQCHPRPPSPPGLLTFSCVL